jgi:uncharacterized protein
VAPSASQPPVAGADSWILSDNTVIAAGVITPEWFLHDDFDPEGSPVFVTSVVGLPAGLVANYDASGHLVSITGTTPVLSSAFGNYSLTYTVSDGLTATTATVSLLIVDTTPNTDSIGLSANDYSYIDLLSGGDSISGGNVLMGTLGRDTFLGNNGTDLLSGGAGDDKLFGNENDDTLNGDSGNDILDGGNNDDTLNGGTVNDVLSGGAGRDKFQFTSSGAANADTITDFDQSNNADLIGLSTTAFGAIGPSLASDEFKSNVGGNATDANDYILFDTNTGRLYYDADGNGGGTKVLIATVTLTGGAAAFDSADFFMF